MRPSLPGRREWLLLALAVGLSLVPHWIPAAMGALLLALFLPGQALQRCFTRPARGYSFADLTLSCGLSLAFTPLVLRFAGLVFPFHRGMVLSVLALASAILMLVPSLGRRHEPSDPPPPTPAAVYVLMMLAVMLLIPTLAVGAAPGGETRIKGWDLHSHLAIAEAITHRGLPPTNPFLATPTPFYYHTFFHLVYATVQTIAGPAAPAYFLIVLLSLFLAALCLAVLYRIVVDLTGRPRAALLSLPFVSILGGYDLLPILGKWIRSGSPPALLEAMIHHWNIDAWVSHRKFFIPTFLTQSYWSPHAVAGIVALLLALLFLERKGAGPGDCIVAGICLASMAGFNGYVALGGAVTVAFLRGTALLGFVSKKLKDRRASLGRSALAGSTALLLCYPVLSLYFGERGDVDKFRALGAGPLLPFQILIEFGPALVCGLAGAVLCLRHRELRRGMLPFALLGAAGLPLICSVASTGENNDLAMRVSMLVWICLAAFGGVALDVVWDRRPARGVAALVLLPGLLGILWFVSGASLRKPILPEDEVAAGNWVRHHVRAGALIQGSPLRNNPDLVYLTGHPAVLSDSWAARLFYSVPEDFSRNLAALQETFRTEDPALACPRLASLRIAALVVGPLEESDFPILSRPLPWSCLTPAYQQGAYRVFLVKS